MNPAAEKTAIIGAGPAGLTAAISQASKGRIVTVFEHKERPCIKLGLTGNGKCNFTNSFMDASCYHESDSSRLGSFLKRYTYRDAIAYLESVGVKAAEKSGFFYPQTFDAVTVADALIARCRQLGIEIICNAHDPDIIELSRSFDRVILACGSRAHKKTGSNGTGYKFLERLGIPYTRVLPALCSLYSDDIFFRINKGIRALGTVTFGEYCATGEIQITERGLSGIPVFNISRYVSKVIDNGETPYVTVNFAPDEKDIPEIIRNRKNTAQYKTLQGPEKRIFRITETASFDNAQVCTGGVSLDILTDDFQVKDRTGIYVIGEMCDVDGICGGYNLHWAWLSGNLCAE